MSGRPRAMVVRSATPAGRRREPLAAAAKVQPAGVLTAALTELAALAGAVAPAGRLVWGESTAAREALRRRQAGAAWSSAEARGAEQPAGLPQAAPAGAGPDRRAAE